MINIVTALTIGVLPPEGRDYVWPPAGPGRHPRVLDLHEPQAQGNTSETRGPEILTSCIEYYSFVLPCSVQFKPLNAGQQSLHEKV